MASLADVSRAVMVSARRAPKLNAADEKALVARHREGDSDALDTLAVANLRHVLSVANSLRGYGVRLDDLVQEGCCGIVIAVRKFDPSKGVPFGAYSRLWAKAEMQEFILRNFSIVRLPMHSAEQKLFFRLRQMRAELSRDGAMTGGAVTAEIASASGLTTTDVDMMQARLGSGDQSMNAPAFDSEGSEWGDFLADAMPSPDDMLDDDQCAADLRAAMAALDDRERLIVEQRWLTDDIAPLNALAEWFEISTATVRRIEIDAIDKLRRTMCERRKRPNPAYA